MKFILQSRTVDYGLAQLLRIPYKILDNEAQNVASEAMRGEACSGNKRRSLRRSTDRKNLNYVYFATTKTLIDNTRKLKIKD